MTITFPTSLKTLSLLRLGPSIRLYSRAGAALLAASLLLGGCANPQSIPDHNAPAASDAQSNTQNAASSPTPTAQTELTRSQVEAIYDEAKSGDESALKMLMSEAERGNQHAQSALGFFYSKGEGGLSQNYAQAAHWYRKAAEQGTPAAQNNLGWMYLRGEGVPQDMAQAEQWLRKSVQGREGNGDWAVQDSLAYLYQMKGLGETRNRVAAYALYSLAEQNGAKKDELSGDRSTFELTAEELEAANTLTREMGRPGNLLRALDRHLGLFACKDLKPLPELAAKYSQVVTLLAESELMECDEKQYWFDTLPSMASGQIDRLLEILTAHRRKLDELYKEYQQEIIILPKDSGY
jgi:hypothetical protein